MEKKDGNDMKKRIFSSPVCVCVGLVAASSECRDKLYADSWKNVYIQGVNE